MEQRPAVRVYANARQFIVIPLIGEIEGVPAHPVFLTMGRPVAYILARALEGARASSRAAPGDDLKAWDGENGRWWKHHLLRVTITWSEDHIRVVPDEGRPARQPKSPVATLPADAPASQVAEWLIRQLSEHLN